MTFPVDPSAIAEVLPAYLGRQRWFAGDEPEKVSIAHEEELSERLLWLLADADDARYSLFVSAVPAASPPEFLTGQETSIIGAVDDQLLFDPIVESDLAKLLLHRLLPDEDVSHVRPMGTEQSNTSVVFDDRLVLKLFRRMQPGTNPDVEVTAALAATGFAHVAPPLATWTHDGTDIAVVQPFLAGAADGWALASTSLRDFYASDCDDPAECGGDFAGEARRLGEMTAKMHLALADAFGSQPAEAGQWIGPMVEQLERIAPRAPWHDVARARFEALSSLSSVGVAIRVHGDYHLGQVLRVDTGWFVLDFEGEPARAVAERRRKTSPLKDVAGMLRSFDYAAAVAVRERAAGEWKAQSALGDMWVQRNRNALIEGYLATDGIGALLPERLDDLLAAVCAWELDKAVYEVGYERAHRPDWVDIPERAISRLTGG